MIRLSRTVAVVGSALAIAVAFGCGAAGGIATRAVSPCGTATAPTWSPDGTQIAWFGYRWPLPPHRHAVGSWNILRAFCASDADGKRLHQLARATLSAAGACSNNLGGVPGLRRWVQLIYLVYRIVGAVRPVSWPQGQPETLAQEKTDPYALDARGDRVATSDFASACTSCRQPSRLTCGAAAPSSGVVGEALKLKTANRASRPTRIQFAFFTRTPCKDSGQPAISNARPTVAHLQRLERKGDEPALVTTPAIGWPTWPRPGPARSPWRLHRALHGRRCGHRRSSPRPRNRLRLRAQTATGWASGHEGEARRHRRHDGKGAGC